MRGGLPQQLPTAALDDCFENSPRNPVAVHDGPVSSQEDFYHEWETASDCVDYLNAWRAEFERALSGQLERTGSPQERLIEGRRHGRYAFSLEVSRLRRELSSQDEPPALQVYSAIASLDENDPLIRQEVLSPQQHLAERGAQPYAAADAALKHPPCPHCGKPLRTPGARQCRFCGRDWH